MRTPPPKERAPGGQHLRWRHRGRVLPWQPRVPVRKTCLACARHVIKGHYIAIGEAVVERHWTAGGLLCDRHPVVHVAAPCPGCSEVLYVQRGPRVVRGRLVPGAEWVTWRGEVVRSCPGCGAVLMEPVMKEVQNG